MLLVLMTSAAQASRWGPVIDLGEAALTGAPALWVTSEQVAAAWVTAPDATGEHLLRPVAGDEAGKATALPLPVRQPERVRLVPLSSTAAHLLWVDVPFNQPSESPRLWGALLSDAPRLERGEIPLTDGQVYHYDAVRRSATETLVVWSDGLPAEPTIRVRVMDSRRRLGPVHTLVSDGDWARLLPLNDGTLRLYWLDGARRNVLGGAYTNDAINEARVITPLPLLDPGDRLTGFEVGADAGHVYLFWHITRAAGTFETWYSSSLLDVTAWRDPAPLAISPPVGGALVTGFNGGMAQVVAPGERPVRWAAPLEGQFDALPLAAQVEDTLGVLYMARGEVIGYQPVVTLPPPGLIGAPGLAVDRDRHLYLTWAQPALDAPAALLLTKTRR
jgi:hypothetical protein